MDFSELVLNDVVCFINQVKMHGEFNGCLFTADTFLCQRINPLQPNVIMHIVHTVLYTFPRF